MAAKKAKKDYGLEHSPKDAAKAILLLREYVLERIKLVEDKKLEDVPAAVKMMDAIDRFTDEVQSLVKAPAEVFYNNLRFTVVPEMMDAADITTIGVDEVGKVHLQDDIRVKVEDKEALFTWLKDNDLGDLITDVVNAQTLAASLRARIKENAELAAKAQKSPDFKQEDLEKVLLAMPAPTTVNIQPLVRAVIKRK